MTLSIAVCLVVGGQRRQQVIVEQEKAASDMTAYMQKKYECSGVANTTNAFVNKAGLTNCGGDLAVKASLKIATVNDIYYNYCSMTGWGVQGCTIPLTGRVYVCMQGTTVYRRVYNIIYYYSCQDMYNTIRHELLHLVYFGLTPSQQQSVVAKLAKYESIYADQLAGYKLSDRDDELFVRVGADGRQVDDIELIDLYAKVSSAYKTQKQKYYGSLADTSDSYSKKYKELSDKYSVLLAISVIVLIVNLTLLIYVGSKLKSFNKDKKSKKRAVNYDAVNNEFEDIDLEHLRSRIENMNEVKHINIKEEFDEFKKKCGLVDTDDEE